MEDIEESTEKSIIDQLNDMKKSIEVLENSIERLINLYENQETQISSIRDYMRDNLENN